MGATVAAGMVVGLVERSGEGGQVYEHHCGAADGTVGRVLYAGVDSRPALTVSRLLRSMMLCRWRRDTPTEWEMERSGVSHTHGLTLDQGALSGR